MRHQLATFKLDDRLYGVDVSRVQEALKMQAHTPVPHAPEAVAGLVNLRGQVVLMVDLRARLGRAPYGPDDEPMMMVVNIDGEPVSLLVDQVGDVLELDSDSFGPPPPTLEASLQEVVTGVYSLENDLLLSLDVDLAAQV
ncbi:chemotaxis protein CheW [Demequina capsici]|uniref:Chemotaxis protein CheW n=1 Tax=Demequina capsici TaxID=3075620 RepID=A0AA96FBW0_9MICO|nr:MULTISPECIES: chemotaxis protein CheW [unclassified Demequina]WNM24577.1 chemotaxis protein CheW [Demequina sp. OYTSA14]WNM27429.1 chemotaxis protein CheW [Demequina sp. PMTSA13]